MLEGEERSNHETNYHTLPQARFFVLTCSSIYCGFTIESYWTTRTRPCSVCVYAEFRKINSLSFRSFLEHPFVRLCHDSKCASKSTLFCTAAKGWEERKALEKWKIADWGTLSGQWPHAHRVAVVVAREYGFKVPPPTRQTLPRATAICRLQGKKIVWERQLHCISFKEMMKWSLSFVRGSLSLALAPSRMLTCISSRLTLFSFSCIVEAVEWRMKTRQNRSNPLAGINLLILGIITSLSLSWSNFQRNWKAHVIAFIFNSKWLYLWPVHTNTSVTNERLLSFPGLNEDF